MMKCLHGLLVSWFQLLESAWPRTSKLSRIRSCIQIWLIQGKKDSMLHHLYLHGRIPERRARSMQSMSVSWDICKTWQQHYGSMKWQIKKRRRHVWLQCIFKLPTYWCARTWIEINGDMNWPSALSSQSTRLEMFLAFLWSLAIQPRGRVIALKISCKPFLAVLRVIRQRWSCNTRRATLVDAWISGTVCGLPFSLTCFELRFTVTPSQTIVCTDDSCLPESGALARLMSFKALCAWLIRYATWRNRTKKWGWLRKAETLFIYLWSRFLISLVELFLNPVRTSLLCLRNGEQFVWPLWWKLST